MSVILINDTDDLIRSDKFPYGTFSFEYFNPVQSAVFKIYNEDKNCLVSAPTSVGKTAIAEMFGSHEIRANKGKLIYLSPFKALSQEKYDDWSNASHHMSDLKISICTGDYQITPDRKDELDNADVIIMTYEVLNSVCRSNSDKCNFLKGNITVVYDEVHLFGTASRGSHLEVSLINLTRINQDGVRIVALSATIPNACEIAEWISSITRKDSFFLKSEYRPCELNKHYRRYIDKGRYDDKETRKIEAAIEIVKKYPDDKFLIFAHTKKTGLKMLETLKENNINSGFHNADLDKDDRCKLENNFKNNKDMRVLVATATLEAGINVPARRGVILGVHRGLQEVWELSILQAAGRCGRPQYDPEGDCYILLPNSKFNDWKYRIENPPDVTSSLVINGDHRILGFHIVSEIHHGFISNRKDLKKWFKNTLASYQNQKLDEQFIDDMIDGLKQSGILCENEGKYELTSLGKISSMFYYSPYDVSSLHHNFDKLLKSNKTDDDYHIAIALANTDTHRRGIANSAEVAEAEAFKCVLNKKQVDCDRTNSSVIKVGFAYYLILNNKENPVLTPLIRNIRFDFSRTLEVLKAINSIATKWNMHNWFDALGVRINYGVGWDVVPICRLDGIGAVKSKRLFDYGLKTVKDIAKNIDMVKLALGCSDEVAKKITEQAKEMTLV